MNDLRLIPLILGFVFDFFLGSLILLRNKKNPINISYSIIIFLAALWIFSIYCLWISNNSFTALFWAKISFVGPTLIPPVLIYFSKVFPIEIKSKLLEYLVYISCFFSGIILIMTLTDNIISHVVLENGVVIPKPGKYYLSFLIYFVFFVSMAYYFLLKKYFKERGVRKNQIKYLFAGTIITASIGLLINIVIPAFGINGYTFLGPLSILVMLVSTYYAIVKHRLMDIRKVVARSVAYAILIAVIAIVYAATVFATERLFFPQTVSQFNLGQTIFRTFLAVVLVFTFQPLRKWITQKTDRLFFKEAYSTEDFLNKLTHQISSTIVLTELLHKTMGTLIKDIKVSRAFYVIFNKENQIYTTLSLGFREELKVDAKEMQFLSKNGLLVYDELAEEGNLKNAMNRYQSAVAIPLRTEKELVGLLMLGEKSSGDMFSSQDLQIFEIIAPEIAIAVQNAKAYEEIQKFNISLKEGIRKATHELSNANDHLMELDKAKDEFISMASHQLRTPLTAIKGYLSMLLEGDAGEVKKTQEDFLNEAYDGANKMVALISDLLNVSRMETGRFFLEPIKFELEKIIREETKQLVKTAEDKNLELKLEIKDVPRIFADEVKIRQVVMNFIDNAIHYTKKGVITMKLYQEDGNVCFEVHDNGIGIPQQQQAKLFSKFYRADNARKVRPDGTGLGLYLARKVIEEHKGELIFSSEVGVGSVFGFRLPIKAKIKPANYNELSSNLLASH